MNLYYPWHLVLLVLLVPLILLLIRLQGKRSKRFSRFAERQFMAGYLQQESSFLMSLKLVLLFLALSLIVLALARPQWDYEMRNFETQGLDIMVCLDISRSMEAQDLTPSRLQRAKLQLDALLSKLQGDRVGVVAFAGKATLECPLTDDYESASLVIKSLSTDVAVLQGTDIGAALALAERSFTAAGGSKILMLITDGEDLGKSAVAQARRLSASGVRIYTMGVGTATGVQITEPGTGRKAFTKLDSATLQQIAAAGEGKYYALTSGQGELDLILRNIYSMEKGRERNQNISALKEQYAIPVLMALLLLALETLVLPLRREWR